MDNIIPLGLSMRFHAFALSGVLSKEEWKSFLNDVTQAIEMGPVYEPAVWEYPLADKGGNGQTIVQPITESFLAVDTWPDHKGAYLIVCSCRNFDAHAVKLILRKWNLSLGGECGHSLSIPNGESKLKKAF